MRVNLEKIIDAQSMGATITGSSQGLDQAFGYSVQAIYTGSPVGDIKLQASLDHVNWSDIGGSDQSIAAAGSFVWNVSDVQYPYFRVVYTRASGSGSLTVYRFYRGF